MLRIFVGTDFGPSSTLALKQAQYWNQHLNASLHLIHVDEVSEQLEHLPLTLPDLHPKLNNVLQTKMQEQIGQIVCPIYGIKKDVIKGKAESVLIKMLDEHPESLLFLGSQKHHLLQRFFYGSLSEKLVSTSPAPLVLIRKSVKEVTKILIPIDFSFRTPKLLHWVKKLAHAFNAQCHLLHIVSTQMREYSYEYPFDATSLKLIADLLEEGKKEAQVSMDKLLQEIRQDVPSCTGEVITSTNFDIGQALLSYLSKTPVDLVMMSTHGNKGLETLLLGSVAQTMIRHYDGNIFLSK